MLLRLSKNGSKRKGYDFNEHDFENDQEPVSAKCGCCQFFCVITGNLILGSIFSVLLSDIAKQQKEFLKRLQKPVCENTHTAYVYLRIADFEI
jgi:hypothetical protein